MPIGGAVRGWGRPIGTLLILTPLLVLIGLGLLDVLLGSMGMDIHWTSSKAAFYVAMTCSILLLCGRVMAGIRLRKSPKASRRISQKPTPQELICEAVGFVEMGRSWKPSCAACLRRRISARCCSCSSQRWKTASV
jgi:hypothetical protein